MLNAKQLKNMQNSTTIQFENGKTYLMGWIGDSDLKTRYKVIKRTAKFVTLESRGETVRCKVQIYDGVEQCSPTGKYSMSPTLRASKLKPEPVQYKGFEIVPSTRLNGWFMTTCETVCGESVDEVKLDIDNAGKYEVVEVDMAAMIEVKSKKLAPIISLFG